MIKSKDILNEVELIRGKVTYMEDMMNNMARNVDVELVNIKDNQRKVENKLYRILNILQSKETTKEDDKDKGPHFKFPHVFLPNKPSVPEYEMDKNELDNDLLTQGKYKQKTNFTIKSTEIDLTKVDWDKSYILLSFKGMTDYCLTLKQNNRSFSKFSDHQESLEITQLSKLELIFI